MLTDHHGLELSTALQSAAADYREGLALMLSAWPGADAPLERAIAADPNFALAHAALARVNMLRLQADAARTGIARATQLVSANGTERERSHVATLSLVINGKPVEALEAALGHVDRWPRDILIFGLPLGAFGLFAFSGMADHDQARVDLCERHADAFDADDWWYLTYRGWSLAENGEVSRGRALLERACELRRANANGIHALAHAMFEGGAHAEAETLISNWLPEYDPSGVLHGHLAWHAALVALERGDAAGALAIYERQVQPSVSHGMPINIVSDGASLLWRMDAYGHAAPTHLWRELADYAATAFPKAGHAFIDPHMAMIEAATGNRPALNQRITTLGALTGGSSKAAGIIVPEFCRAAQAFRDRDYATCARTLAPLRAEAARIGGSGAQREVIEDTLLLAMMRAGDVAPARALLDERLHRRPSTRDRLWRGQIVG